jgi:hypothetical protein
VFRRTSIALSLVVFVGAFGGAAMADDDACSFQAGQEWSVKSGNGAKVVISRVEDWRGQKAVHVSITAIKIRAGFRAGTVTEIVHAPFSCASLQRSIRALLRTDSDPPQGFENGYQQWRDAKGGIFTIGVNEVSALTLKPLSGD